MFHILYKSFVVSGLSTVVSYSLTIFLTYQMFPDKYGEYLIAITWAGLIGIFIDYSTSSVFSHLAAKENGLCKAINTVLYLRLFLFITIFIFSVFISFLDFDFPLLSLFFILGVFNLGFLYEYKRQNVKFALVTLVEKALFAILVYLISMVSIDVLHLCLCYLAASISSLVLQYLEYREDVFNIGIPRTRPILQFMGNYVQFYIITITQLSYGITSRLIFESRMGLEAFVYFSLAMQVIALASILQSQVDRVFRPEIIQNIQSGDRDALFSTMRTYAFSYLVPMLALAICIYFLSDNIVSLVLDASYQDVAGYLSALSPLFVTVPLMRLADQFMLATDYFNENLIINIGVTCGLLGSLAFTDAENGHFFALIIIAWQLVHAVTAFTFINSRLRKLS